MPENTETTQTTEPTALNDTTSPKTEPAGQTPPSVPDRSTEQMFRELQRRDQERQKQIDAVLSWIQTSGQATRTQPAPASVDPSHAEPTDDDLWTLAQNGDRQAFELYQRRIAQRELKTQTQQQSRANVIVAQIQALTNRYPVLRDPSHALTQTVQQAYTLLVQAGYGQDSSTLLEAMKTAIADRPDLIAELHGQAARAREHSRLSTTTRAQSGMMGSSPRQSTQEPVERQPSQEEIRLASRMGVKDIKKAKDAFMKRQETGRSSLGAIGGHPAIVKEMEDFA